MSRQSSSCCSRCSACFMPRASGSWRTPIDRLLVWTFAFVPARYDSQRIDGRFAAGRPGAEIWSFVTYALLHADSSIWLQCGLAACLRSPVARRFGAWRFLAVLRGDHCGRRAGPSAAARRRAGADDRRLGWNFRHHGRCRALCVRAGRVARHGAPRSRLCRPRSGGAARCCAAQSACRAFRRPLVRPQSLFGIGSVPFLAGEGQSVAWEAHVGGFLAGLLLFRRSIRCTRRRSCEIEHDPA